MQLICIYQYFCTCCVNNREQKIITQEQKCRENFSNFTDIK